MLKLTHICLTIGGRCGSTAIDRAFTELMETWFGTAFTNLPSGKRHVNSKFMKEFESVKQGFNGSGSFQTHRLGLKMTPQASDHYDYEEEEVLLRM